MSIEKVITVLFLLLSQGNAFAPNAARIGTRCLPHETAPVFSLPSDFYDDQPLVQMVASEKRGFFTSRIAPKVAGLVSGLCGYVARGMAEDVEYAELPPPYVPAIFGVVLLAGVGFLTVSLGDVMQEGT